jgi:putative phosphoribosyl transferase
LAEHHLEFLALSLLDAASVNFREDAFGSYDPHGYRRWLFRDRAHAGAQLAARLLQYKGDDPLVVGLPRGGMLVAAEVALRVDGELDVKVARKLPAPEQPQLAIAAVTDDGSSWLNRPLIVQLGLSSDSVDQALGAQLAEAKHQEQRLRRNRPQLDPSGRIVILVDDGLATGASMRAAAQALRAKAHRLVAAVPIGNAASRAVIEGEFDEVVCLHLREPFLALARHYRSLDDATDRDVERVLREHRQRRSPASEP